MSISIPAGTLEKFTTFGDLLRYLRRAAGLTQLELSIQVGYSHAQISRLEQNLRLPDIPTVEARFVPALGLTNELQVIARLLELAANMRREDAPGLGLCPYKGLSYFDETDADLFVGREALTAKLTERILSSVENSFSGKRFLAVVGASGSGKSSLVRAGVIPSLRWNRRSAEWQIHVLTPTAHPLESLATRLNQENPSILSTTRFMDELAADSRSLQIFAKRKLQAENGNRLMLVIDQFEELFALCRSEVEQASFIGNLLSASTEAHGPVLVLIALRADFYANCATHPLLREALALHQEYIGAMNEDELRRAILEPARRGRWEFEPGLVDLLLHEVGHEPGALPLLSHALFETWQRRRGRTMTLSGYTSAGGVRGAISETAETVFTDQLTHEERNIARRIFLRLTELNDEGSNADTRRRAKLDELILKPEQEISIRTVLNALADARLIITDQDSVEVAHEALIREWPRLRGWLQQNRESLNLHRQLTEAAQGWQTMERAEDLLYRGARLAQVREWGQSHLDEMNELECEFLDASVESSDREAREREAQRQRELDATRRLADSEKQRAEEQTISAKRLRQRAIYLTVAFISALMMAFAALFFGKEAQAASHLATSRELAAASISNLGIDPERSILLALDALQSGYTIEAENALHQAVQASRVRRVLQAHEPGAPMMLAFSPDGKQFVSAAADGSVKIWDRATGELVSRLDGYYAAYSRTGKQMAIVSTDKTVRLIDPSTGKDIALAGQIDAVKGVAFSPDGSRLVTAALNNTPKIWDAKTGSELVSFPGHTDFVDGVVFSPDGNHLLTVSDDGTSRVWDASTGQQQLSLSGHPGWVWSARYSPDGKYIVTGSGNDVILWDASSGDQLHTFSGHTNQVYVVAFSPDGTRLATAGADRKIKLWDVATGNELFTLSGHTDAIYGLTFSPDGKQLLSGSSDGTIRVWDLTPSHEFLALPAHGSSGQIAFSNDGNRLATTDEYGSIRVWDAHSGKDLITLEGSKQNIRDLIFNSNGTRLLSTADNGALKMWDLAMGTQLAEISTFGNTINSIAITRDGTHLATAGEDYKAKIWDISSGNINEQPLFILENPGIVNSVAFNADGTRLAIGTQDGTIKLWDTATGKQVQILRGHQDAVTAVTFSPDGTQIVSSSLDGTARIWNIQTGQALHLLSSHTDAVTSVAYSPDGTRIATASRDGTARLWMAATGEEILTFWGDGSGLSEVAFSPDGTRLATGGENGARVYLLAINDLIALAKTRLTRSLTSEECQKYLHLEAASCSSIPALPTTTAMPPATNKRICQVTTIAGLYDRSFNEMIFHGLQRSAKEFNWDAKVLQSTATREYEKNIDEFLRSDCDLIVASGQMEDAIQAAAEMNPNQKFWVPDFAFDPPLKNVRSQTFAVNEASFLAGYTAASVTQTGKVGIFGGIDIPSVTGYMDGFALGVQYYNKVNGTNIQVLGWDPQKHEGLFIGGFCCAAEGREITQKLLDSGADIILPVAGTSVAPGAAHAVQQHGNAYLIGVDIDWALIYPEYADVTLTSIIKNYDVSVLQAVQAIVDGTFTGGINTGTLETGEVGLAPFHELDALISPQVKTELDQIKRDIISGKIKTGPE